MNGAQPLWMLAIARIVFDAMRYRWGIAVIALILGMVWSLVWIAAAGFSMPVGFGLTMTAIILFGAAIVYCLARSCDD